MALKLRNIVIGAVAIAAIGGAVWVSMQPEVVPVDLAEVNAGPMFVTVNADGITQVRNVYEVSAPVSGKVLRSPVSVGDIVAAGGVVAQIEPGEPAFLDERSRAQAEAAVAQAQAGLALARTQVTAAEADLNNAQRSLNRVFELNARGAATDAQLEGTETAVEIAAATLDSAHATVEMRESEVRAAQAVLIEPGTHSDPREGACCVDITAPVSGTVLSVTSTSERVVAAGSPLLSIGPTDDLEIVVELLSTDAVRLAPGAEAFIERWGGARSLSAVVREIEPAAFTKISALGIEEQRVRVILEFNDPDLPALGHNFRVYARVVEWARDDALQVPISALFRDGDEWAVFTEVEGVAVLTPLDVGQRNSDVAEVLGGLSVGDMVITHPSDRVSDGVLIEPRDVAN